MMSPSPEGPAGCPSSVHVTPGGDAPGSWDRAGGRGSLDSLLLEAKVMRMGRGCPAPTGLPPPIERA